MRRLALSLLLAIALTGCRADRPEPVWFVHVTDPHLFYGEPRWAPAQRKRHEELNRKALEDLLRTLRNLPGTDARPALLVITGDFGIDRFLADVKSPESVKAQENLAKVLAASPVRDIYFVPGNNDVAKESASREAYAQTQAFFKGVEDRTQGAVSLRDLTSCYFTSTAPCEADVQGTSFRLIGFPSHSFKNSEEAGSFQANRVAQEAQADRLKVLVEQAENAGRKVLILSHIPELDDPHTQAEDRFAGKAPPQAPEVEGGRLTKPRWSAWNVSLKVFQTWKDVVSSDAVAGVLAGHFHDSHREIYYWPWRWSSAAGDRADPRKVFLAPPLSVRFQDTSPRQARGFVLVGLQDDRVTRRFYWYHPGRGIFRPDPAPERRTGWRWPDLSYLWRWIPWVWELGEGGSDSDKLARATVAAIALLAAFLTVIQVWQIPPPTRTRVDVAQTSEGKTTTVLTATDFSSSLLANNFARTVLSGLVGLAAVTFIDEFFGAAGTNKNAKAHYLVLFVSFFLGLLILSATFRSLAEALRSRIVLSRPMPRLPPLPNQSTKGSGQNAPEGARDVSPRTGNPVGPSQVSLGYRFRRWGSYWTRRIWYWVASFRTNVLVFIDTFFNLIQGRNQMQSAVFSEKIIDLHEDILHVAERVRDEVDRLTLKAVQELAGNPAEPSHEEIIRVGVTLLSADESTVYYIARERGSYPKPFEKHSVAWVAAFTGQARWVKTGREKAVNWDEVYAKNSEAELYDNTAGSIPGPSGKLLVGQYYQPRGSEDYKAFIVLPVPWSDRGRTEGQRRGAIHISFQKPSQMDAIWSGLETGGGKIPNYGAWKCLLAPAPLEGSPMKPETPAPAGEQRPTVEELRAWARALEEESQHIASRAKELSGRLQEFGESGSPAEDATSEATTEEKETPLRIHHSELCSVLHESLVVLGEALAHFDDEVYDTYVRLRRHS